MMYYILYYITCTILIYIMLIYILYICTSIYKILCKYWPDDGPFRPKLVAKSNIIIKYCIIVSDGIYNIVRFINVF
jgi:hypothetical protein